MTSWFDIGILSYAIAVGFVWAGIVASFYQLMTAKPPQFGLFGSNIAAYALTFFFFAVTGPFIIMRQAIKARTSERQPIGWLFGSLAVAAMWSGCSGLFVLDFALSARSLLS